MISTKYYEQVPPENRVLTCPHCHKEQNMYNIPKRKDTSTEWVAHECDHCGKLFGYIQIVERIYVAVATEEPKEVTQ